METRRRNSIFENQVDNVILIFCNNTYFVLRLLYYVTFYTKPESIQGHLVGRGLVVAQNDHPKKLEEGYRYEDESSDKLNTTKMSVSELIDQFEETVKIRPIKYEGRKSLNLLIRCKEDMQSRDDPDHHYGNRQYHDGPINFNEDVQVCRKQHYNENHKA
ncbi:unnamed protein product [Angiostrongylus costaricensis]|uniref:Uncharacterized protein n=1 Tax=Angiostrongylus costaricensis TaxID=334426 RepID=A0A0R3PGR7_ANGCS|nr:unnamed protein product [Angiostrongylus costaricensis]